MPNQSGLRHFRIGLLKLLVEYLEKEKNKRNRTVDESIHQDETKHLVRFNSNTNNSDVLE